MSSRTTCPCGNPARYPVCCGRLLRGQADAATPEELMRSRFTAFALGDAAHLLESWHPGTRPARLALGDEPRWQRLDILRTSGGSAFHDEGTVEFRAHFTDRTGPGTLHEHSRFVRHRGRWVYVDGEILEG